MLPIRLRIAAGLRDAGLYLFAFSAFLWEAGFYAGLALLLLGTLLAANLAWTRLQREPTFWIATVLATWILSSVYVASQQFPLAPTAHAFRQACDLWVIGGLFSLLVAWTIDGQQQRIRWVLTLAMAGLLLAILIAVDWRNAASYLAGRPLFGLGNGTAAYALAGMVGLLILGANTPSRGPVRIGLVLLFAVLVAVHILCQTRGAWIAALLVLPVVLAVLSRRSTHVRPGGVLLATSLVLMLALLLGIDTFRDRWLQEWTSIRLLLQGNLAELPLSSVSLRVWLWQDALHNFGEHPVSGWGAGSAGLLIAKSGIPGHFSHYHNVYLQLAVELGLPGLLLFVGWLACALRSVLQSWRQAQLGADYLLFVGSVFAVYLLVSAVEYQHNEAGQAFVILLGALATTHGMRRRAIKQRKYPSLDPEYQHAG